ncbi:Wzz/FepE/Etk N-terminal domain-containing protein [Flavobacteriales bacterium]|nr:Wzz/FepE/Etk N-terminal domain-containing protein [Flavobacteriales bacterium]
MTTSQNNHAEDLLQFIWNKRKLIILITIIAAIAAIIYSLLIEEKFKSTVTLYPAMSNTVAFTDEVHPEQSAAQFGEEEQAEQMIQILQSAEIRNSIVEKYNLMEHYEIDTASKIKYTSLNKMYEENVSFSRTKYGSVLVDVMDKNPEMAADMANDIANLFDNTKNRMINERSSEALNVALAERDKLKNDISGIVDTLGELNKLGVVDKETRPTLITALSNAKDGSTKKLIQNKILATDKFGSIYSNYENKLEWMNIRLSTKDAVYEQLKSDAKSTFSHKFTLEKASVSEKKAYPIRWLIVAVSTISAFLFAIILLLIFEKLKELKRQES